jgi:arsenate reductase
MNELDVSYDFFEYHDLKNNPISIEELDEISKVSGLDYEELFNKRAQKYREIKDKIKTSQEFRNAIVSEYTFLKRPILKIESEYFVGNSKVVVEAAKNKLM